MTDPPTFNCSACGAPNYPEAGKAQMPCAYCGANIKIPEKMRVKATPRVDPAPSKAKPVVSLEKDAPDILRKAQPIAIKAWNMYAYWTWIRWLLPTCLVVTLIAIAICAALGMLPVLLAAIR
ncbi:MAG: hypothetical protein HYZ23_01695 [Chloroflexi bacterium]|nr:hypothetical protein [Chloroflexota bacterium]